MKLSEFDYKLPQEFIAQIPAEPRDSSKLMVIHRDTGFIEHKHFYDIADYLDENDVLVANSSKVMAARLFGKKSTGARVEILLLHKEAGNKWQALVKPAKRLRIGDEIFFGVDKNYGIKQKDTGILSRNTAGLGLRMTHCERGGL